MMTKGVALSLITTALFAFFEVCFRYVGVEYNVHPVIFTCFVFFVSATILVLIAGPGRGGVSTLRELHTWGFGIMEILMNISVMFAFIYITATEMNFLARATMLFSLIINWIFLHKAPKRLDLIGVPLVIAGLSIIIFEVLNDVRGVVLFWMFWVSLTSTIRSFIAETHPTSNKANTIKDRCRVTGYVLAVSSLGFLMFMSIITYFKAATPVDQLELMPIISSAPNFSDFLHAPTVMAGIIIGGTVVPLSMYFYFYATRLAKADIFIMITSFLPFFSYAFELTANLTVGLDIESISNLDLGAGVIMSFGALVMIYARKDENRSVAKTKPITPSKVIPEPAE